MIQHNSKRWDWRLIFVVSIGIFLMQFGSPGMASAQVLNQEVNSLLNNNCSGLGIIGSPPNTAGLGPNLASLCEFQQVPIANTTGGGAASVQGSAASILNRVLLQRMYETDEEEDQASARSSSMKFNPFSSLLSGFGHVSSVSSPLYAATTADGGSAASFTSGSQRRWNGLGFFVSGLVESLNRDITTFQDGYKSNILGITGGADYRFSKKLVTGLAFSYSNTDGDFRSGGNFSTKFLWRHLVRRLSADRPDFPAGDRWLYTQQLLGVSTGHGRNRCGGCAGGCVTCQRPCVQQF